MKKIFNLAGSLLEDSFNNGNEIDIPSLGIKIKKDNINTFKNATKMVKPIMTKKVSKFRMKKLPKEPEREMIEFSLDTYNFDNLEQIVNHFNEINVPLQDVRIYENYEYTEFRWELPEGDDSFNARMKTYEEKVAEYKKWEYENKDKIKDYLKKKKEDELEKNLKRLEREKKERKNKIKKLENEKKRLEKTLYTLSQIGDDE